MPYYYTCSQCGKPFSSPRKRLVFCSRECYRIGTCGNGNSRARAVEKNGFIGENLTGKEFGRWKVEAFSHRNKNIDKYWLCICSCGNKRTVKQSSLISGSSESCGCLNKEINTKIKITHGMSRSRLYSIWSSMKSRCYDYKNEEYHNYGGRGIIICERWINSFINFYNDMGNPPSRNYTIDRKDTNGNYSKENCKWSTMKEQTRNKRNNINIYFNGKTMCLMDWSIELKIKYGTLRHRIFVYGWSIERAFTENV